MEFAIQPSTTYVMQQLWENFGWRDYLFITTIVFIIYILGSYMIDVIIPFYFEVLVLVTIYLIYIACRDCIELMRRKPPLNDYSSDSSADEDDDANSKEDNSIHMGNQQVGHRDNIIVLDAHALQQEDLSLCVCVDCKRKRIQEL